MSSWLAIAAPIGTSVLSVRMRVQHLRMKHKFPDWEPARGIRYEDIENLRPETMRIVETWLKIYGDARDVVLGVEAAGN